MQPPRQHEVRLVITRILRPLPRPTCATHFLEGGTDIRYIQKILGHASPETTAIYTEMNVESLRQVFSECHPAEKRWKERGA